jgi:hypothetical protein
LFKPLEVLPNKSEFRINNLPEKRNMDENDTKPHDLQEDIDLECMEGPEVEEAPSEDEEMPQLRPKRQVKQPAYLKDYVMAAELSSPSSFSEAINSEDGDLWKSAMEDEMNSLKENDVWTLVDLPNGKRVINNRWVFRVKTKADGAIQCYKARLVAKGCAQRLGIDYEETFSPVARFETVRAVLSVAAVEKLKLQQFDVKTAFLYGKLDEEVYMQQPQGYEDGTNRVCRLNRSIYGLKQAPRCWNNRLVAFLEKQGMKRSTADHCLFVRNRMNKKLLVVIYVDDGLIAGTDDAEMSEFLRHLKMEFKITMGPLSSFLGMGIQQLNNGSIFVSQGSYTRKVLERFRFSDANAVSTPAEPGATGGEDGADDQLLDGRAPYREAVGSLMFLMVVTRPDIAYAVSVVSQSLECPTNKDWKAVKRIFRYLRGTADYGLLYKVDSPVQSLHGFSDADYAGDLKTRHSRTGVVCMYSGGAISWFSQKQRSVVLSTTEAEYVAASEAAKELVWLKRLFSEVTCLKDSPKLLVDNMSAVKLANNPEFHQRSKHIDVKYHFVREKCSDGTLNIGHVEGLKQVADILTKPLAGPRFKTLCEMLGLVDAINLTCV